MLAERVHVPGFTGDKELPLARLYRYMPVEACRRLVERGEVRVSSSTNFNRDETLSETRRDDEQKKQVSTVLHKITPKACRSEGIQRRYPARQGNFFGNRDHIQVAR